jgi:hypothetical protein
MRHGQEIWSRGMHVRRGPEVRHGPATSSERLDKTHGQGVCSKRSCELQGGKTLFRRTLVVICARRPSYTYQHDGVKLQCGFGGHWSSTKQRSYQLTRFTDCEWQRYRVPPRSIRKDIGISLESKHTLRHASQDTSPACHCNEAWQYGGKVRGCKHDFDPCKSVRHAT